VTLVDEFVDAHGGDERWRKARRIKARVRSGGFLIRSRVPGNRFADYRLEVSVAEPRSIIDPFPGDGMRAVFETGAARIERNGDVVQSRADPRSAFSGASGLRRNLRWDALDSAYFAGYAMWNYMTLPRLLRRRDVEVAEGDPWQEGGERWRRLEVDFPDGFDTHSRHQTLYLDARGLLRRHDYVAEVVGGWAKAAHYCADHAKAGGLVFPTRRWVRPIGPGNRSLPFPTMVWIDLTDLQVETD
jgi:hypothetical protein